MTRRDGNEALSSGPVVGVLAVQGDFEAHGRALRNAGAIPLEVRHPAELEKIQGLILPGGESTTALKFLERDDFLGAIRRAADRGMPVFGTCAGAVLMAGEVVNSRQLSLNLLDIGIRRNAYGRQLASFITREPVEDLGGGPLEMVFIRGPVIERVGPGVQVLAECRGKPVLVRQGNRLAATFHPELTSDLRVHSYFLEMLKARSAAR